MPRIPESGEKPSVKARIEIIERGINGYRLRTESDGASVVVVSQMYYPGWRATADGLEIPVYPVNMALTGFIAPAGSREIRLFFRPLSFLIGLTLSVVSLVVTSGLLIWRKVRLDHLQPQQ